MKVIECKLKNTDTIVNPSFCGPRPKKISQICHMPSCNIVKVKFYVFVCFHSIFAFMFV